MYRLGEQAKHRHTKRIVSLSLVMLILLLGYGINLFIKNLKSNTVINQSSAVITKVSAGSLTQRFQESAFSINLPMDWKPKSDKNAPPMIYTWQAPLKGGGQVLSVYMDTIPTDFAVNRVQIVKPAGNHIGLVGQVSGNCSGFAKGDPASLSGLGAHASWKGIDFICDVSNYERQVVGISSHDGINRVNLQGKTGRHGVFITYTDNTINPDYSSFYDILTSFRIR